MAGPLPVGQLCRELKLPRFRGQSRAWESRGGLVDILAGARGCLVLAW